MELTEALGFAAGRSQGVLVTIRRDGRPQLSNVLYSPGLGGAAGTEGIPPAAGAGAAEGRAEPIRISVTDTRAKTRNLRRDPRASLYVPGDSFWAYVVLDGEVTLGPVAEAPDDAAVEELVALYRAIRGEEHPDWDEYRRVMVAERRLVVRLRPERAYGIPGR